MIYLSLFPLGLNRLLKGKEKPNTDRNFGLNEVGNFSFNLGRGENVFNLIAPNGLKTGCGIRCPGLGKPPLARPIPDCKTGLLI